jgi:hypothetical protein
MLYNDPTSIGTAVTAREEVVNARLNSINVEEGKCPSLGELIR